MRRQRSARKRRRAKREWLLLLPLALAVAGVWWGLSISESGTGLLAMESPCVADDTCGPAVALPVSAPAAQGGEPLFVAEMPPPPITAEAVAIIEEPCGALVYGDDADVAMAPASLTKIATALVAVEHADLSETVYVTVDGPELAAATDSTVMGLEPGDRLTLGDMLYGLLLPSGNDAALAIAAHVGLGVDTFVDMMNQKVADLGLEHTHFTNPHGLDDPDHFTSAYDIAMLGRELLHRPELAEIVRTQTYQPAWDKPPVWNGNSLLYDYPDALGIKTGYTDQAHQTLVAAAERDGRLLIVSVLASDAIYEDTVSMFEWAFDSVPSGCQQAEVSAVQGAARR